MQHIAVQLNKDLLDVAADFLNSTAIDFEIISENDFYWHDVATGARILNYSDKLLFKPTTTEEQLFLQLKFHNYIST